MRRFGAGGIGLFLLGATLALGFVAAAQSIGKAMVAMRQESGIRVKGTASQDVRSDQGSWSGTISGRGATLPEAYAAMSASMQRLHDGVLTAGFPETALALSSIRTNAVYALDSQGRTTNRVEAYDLSQTLYVKSADVVLVERLARQATDLVQQGIAVDSGKASFTCSNIDAIKLQLLSAATENGATRARTLAEGSGGKVGKLLSASQGVFQIVERGSIDSSDYGSYDTDTIEKTVRAVVTLEFALDR